MFKAGRLTNQSTQAYVRKVTKNPIITLIELQREENLLKEPFLQHFRPEWSSSQMEDASQVKSTRQPTWSLPKGLSSD